jgi:very-short-patch-repair endonuclease
MAAAPVDKRIASLAASQFGVVERGQLRRLGLTDTAIARRVSSGRLHRVRRGVYAVGHPVLSHTSAAAHWELRPSDAVYIDVTVPGPSRRRGPGLHVHRASRLATDEVATHAGIPVTSAARTILDLAATLPDDRALDRAEVLRLTDVRRLVALAEAHPGHHGAGRLRRALAEHTPGTTLTRSDLEERMLVLCRTRGLPRPRVNSIVAGLEVDLLFAAQRLVVEGDGWAYHRSRAAFERDRDRERDAALALAGHRVLRFTDRQVERKPGTVAAAIAAALSAPAPRA